MPKQPQLLAGRFEMRGSGGRGGQAIIRRAIDHHTDAHVALRITSANSTSNRVPGDVLKRLTSVRADTTVFEVERIDAGSEHVEVLPWVQGILLSGIIQQLKKGAQITDVCTVGRFLCACVGQIHQCGVIHADIKPSNIIIEEPVGTPVLLDFGGATRSGSRAGFFGTPGSSAPEQFGPHTAHASADVYSLAVVLYALACGDHAFPQDTPEERLQASKQGDFVSMARRLPNSPASLTRTIDQALSPDAPSRPSLKELTALLDSHSSQLSLAVSRCAACGASDDGGPKCPCCGRVFNKNTRTAHFESGSLKGRLYRFPDGTYITGRIQLRDHARYVSRRAAHIQCKQGRLRIKNASSKNASTINGKVPTDWRIVEGGTQLQLGDSVATIS